MSVQTEYKQFQMQLAKRNLVRLIYVPDNKDIKGNDIKYDSNGFRKKQFKF